MNINIRHIKPHIGSAIEIDKSSLLDPSVIEITRVLLEQRGVLVFPNINVSDAEQLAFTDALGTRISISQTTNEGKSDVYKVTLDPDQPNAKEFVHATFFWHMDGLLASSFPPRSTILSARQVSAKGGQTEFANTYAAYHYLSNQEKQDIANLRVTHTIASSMKLVTDTPTQQQLKKWSEAATHEYPLVWTHLSGRKSLVLGMTADKVVDMGIPEGRALLSRLLEWAVQPDFHYSHKWNVGDLVIWDNCGTLHRAIPYDKSSGRLMHRTSIAGTEPVV